MADSGKSWGSGTSGRFPGWVLLAAFAGTMPGRPVRAEAPPADLVFEKQTAAIDQTIVLIQGRLREVKDLKTRAAKEGAAVKLSCIDEKLRRVQAAADAATALQGQRQAMRGDARAS